MSNLDQPAPNPPGPPRKRISATTLLLSLGLIVSTTAAIVFGVLYFRKPAAEEVLEQRDTVSPQGKFTGTVNYPISYDSPPNLKLISAKREFEITKQDEKGFTWTALAMPEDIKNDQGYGAEMLARRYRNQLWYLWAEGYLGKTAPSIEDFTWEARGVRAGADTKSNP